MARTVSDYRPLIIGLPNNGLELSRQPSRAIMSLRRAAQAARAYVNPFEAEELALMFADQKQKEFPLGDMPLTVLTAGRVQYDEKWLQDDYSRAQAALAKLSRNGKQIIAKESGHHIHIDEPELVIDAIRELLGATQGPR